MDKLLADRGVINHKIKLAKEKPHLNYNAIKLALNVNGLCVKEDSCSDATNEFIKIIKNVDKCQTKVTNSVNAKVEEIKKKSSTNSNRKENHDVKEYTKLYHTIKIQVDEDKPLKERLRKLKELCQKLPFERTTEDVDNIFRILKTFNTLSSQVEDEMLRLLSNVILYELIEESGVTILGNKGFYIILNGGVKPITVPHVRLIGEPINRFNKPKHVQEIYPNLKPGECFGTLDEINKDDENSSKYLLSETTEPTELLFITTSYYRKVLEKYNTQKHADKLILLKKHESFTVWPHQALVKVANIFTWTVIPANTLICKEGEISPVLAFIQSGSCYVLRKLDVKETKPNGKVVTKTTQVIVGVIEKFKSIGEISLLDGSPMKHSILTKESMKVVVSDESKFQNLDKDVRSLLRQSCSPEFYDITREDVESIYMKQKSENDWKNFKENVISETINARGIRPGQGKWKIIPGEEEIFQN